MSNNTKVVCAEGDAVIVASAILVSTVVSAGVNYYLHRGYYNVERKIRSRKQRTSNKDPEPDKKIHTIVLPSAFIRDLIDSGFFDEMPDVKKQLSQELIKSAYIKIQIDENSLNQGKESK